MDTERKRVLQMLKEGVIDTEEAERLLDSLGSNQPPKAEPVTETSATNNQQWNEVQKQLGEQLSGVKQFVETTIDQISSKIKSEFKEGKYTERMNKQGEKSKQEIKIDRKDAWTYGELKLEVSAGALKVESSEYTNDFLFVDYESQVTKVPALVMQEVDFVKHIVEELATDRAKVKVNCGAGSGKVLLGPAIIWKLNIVVNASALSLDLCKTKWQEARVTLHAAHSSIKLGEVFVPTTLKLNVNASHGKLKLVEGTPIRVKLDNVISLTNIDSLKLKKDGEYWVSENYGQGLPCLDLDIDMNVSNFVVEYYSKS